MTLSFSTYLANLVLDYCWGAGSFTPPATVYCSLFLQLPAPDGTGGVEVPTSGTNYARPSKTNNLTNFPAAASGVKKNGTAIAFNTPSADWGDTVGAGWYDALSGGNLLLFGLWSTGTTRSILSGQSFSININEMIWTINVCSFFLANKIQDLVLAAQSFSRPANLHCAAYTTLPDRSNAGGVEPSAGNYTRVSTANDSTHFPAASGQVKKNALAISFPTPNVDQGVITGLGWLDAATSGNLWLATPLAVGTPMANGVPFAVAANGMTINLT